MARNFRRTRTAAPIADLNVTNMIDLGFTLLIIFMISTPLLIQEQTIKVDLPTETVRPQEKADTTPVQPIVVTKAGEYYWSTRKVTVAELRGLLADTDKRAKPPIIKVSGDKGADFGTVMTVVDEVRKFPNLKKIDFTTQPAK